MKELFQKYREVLAYLFFGVATTLVNIGVFFTCENIFGLQYKISNVIAFILSVLFAFFTNKYFVFGSKNSNSKSFLKEMFLFYWYRMLSFVIDMGMMIIMIELIKVSNFWSKMVTQVVVVVLNYFFSKFLIFKEKKIPE